MTFDDGLQHMITGTTGNDNITLTPAQSNETVDLLSGVDVLTLATSKNNTVTVSNTETIIGGAGNDRVTLSGTTPTGATIDLGGGNDTITLSSGTNVLNVSTSVESIEGGSGTDTITLFGTMGKHVLDFNGGSDTLAFAGTNFDLRSVSLDSVNTVKAGNSAATTFTVDYDDIDNSRAFTGSSGSDTLTVVDSRFDLRSVTLTSVEVMKAGVSTNTTFTLDTGDILVGSSVLGSSGTDTLSFNSATVDLRSTSLSSVEILDSRSGSANTFYVDQSDLASGGSIVGAGPNDTLIAAGTQLDLSSTALNTIDTVKAGTSAATTITIDQSDLSSISLIQGSSGADTLAIRGTSLDLRSDTLSSVEIIKVGSSNSTSFFVDTSDLANGGSVVGGSGTDTLQINSVNYNLTSTTLSNVEVLKAGSASATTFTVEQADIGVGGSILGSSGSDVLITTSTTLDLSSTALSSVETLKAGTSAATTFTVDQGDLAANASITGSSGVDTLATAGTALNLTSATLTSVEVLKSTNTAGTTFTVDPADLSNGGSVLGNSGTDTLSLKSTAFDLTSTTLSSIDVLKAGVATATTFTVNGTDLAAGGSILGSSGSDTLALVGTTHIDLSSTTLSSVETIKAQLTQATWFTVDQADLASNGSIVATGQNDTLRAAGTTLDITSTTLTSVESIVAASSAATTFTVDANDLAANGSVVGSSGNDTLSVKNAAFNLTSTTTSSIETLKAGVSAATTFTIDAADLAAGGSVLGSHGNDTLTIVSTAFDLSSTTVSNIEILKGGSASATTFTVDAADLASGGSVLGNSGIDTLVASTATLDVSSTALSSIEILKAGTTADTTFTADTADLTNGGSVLGNSGTDALQVNSTALDLSSTTLSSVEVLKAGSAGDTTITVDTADLAAGGSVLGNSGTDTLSVRGTLLDVSSTTLSSIEILKAATASATTFVVDNGDLADGGSVLGGAGSDTLVIKTTDFSITNTTLSSIETLKAGLSGATTFAVHQSDLVVNGSIVGSSSDDTLVALDTQLNLTSTTLTSVETLKAGNSAGTTFTVDASDLANGGSVLGSSGTDTIVAKAAALDLSSTTISSIEVLKAGSASATTFTVDGSDLAAVASVVGSSGNDTLLVKSTDLDLTDTALTSIETLKAGTSLATTFKVDAADLASNGTVQGSSGSDTLVATSTSLDLTSTTVNSVETLQVGTTAGTTLTVNTADLTNGGSVLGNAGNDTLLISGTAFDTSSLTLSSIEVLKGGSGAATTFTVDTADLAAGGSILGNSGVDTLLIKSSAFDLSDTTLSNVEVLKAGAANTTFTLDDADLISGGSVLGTTGTDTLLATTTELDLRSTTLSSVEVLKAGTTSGTKFIVDSADLVAGGSVIGGSGIDTLVAGTTSIDTANTTLSGIEAIQAGASAATTFTVTASDLVAGGSVIGSSGNDTLAVKSTNIDLTSTTLTDVETIKAGLATATTFTVDAADLVSGGSVIGSSGSDTLVIKNTAFDLTGTTISSVETLKAGSTGATTFTVDDADMVSGGSIVGNSGTDTLISSDDSLNLASTSLSSVEILKAGTTDATSFIIDAADLAAGGSILGNSGDDTLAIQSTAVDLGSTTLSSVETIKANNSNSTTFTVDAADLASGGSVLGNAGTDTLALKSTDFDLGDTTLSSVEVLKAASAGNTTFKLDTADLLAGGSVIGNSGVDTLLANGTPLDLSSTALSSVEIIKAGSTLDTEFIVDTADLASGGSVIGNTGTDTLTVAGTALNTTNTTLTSVEIIKAGASGATSFTVTQGDLASDGSVIGGANNDTLTSASTAFDLTSTTLTSVEALTAGKSAATTFTVDTADLAGLNLVQGSTGADTLTIKTTDFDLTSTTISSIEILKAGNSDATTFTLDTADLVSGGSVQGSSGIDTLLSNGTSLDLSSTTISSIEILKASLTEGTTFQVDMVDLVNGGSVIGDAGSDTLVVNGTAIDLTSTTLDSIDTLKAGNPGNTTFTVDQADLASGGSVLGNSGIDTLTVKGTDFDLSATTLSSVELLKASTAAATTFTLDQADLAESGTVAGSSGNDILLATGTSLDLNATTLSSVEIIKAGNSGDTTFTLRDDHLISGGSVVGSSGDDTLAVGGTLVDLRSTTLSSVEILEATTANATSFIVDQSDLANGGSVLGNASIDTLTAGGTSLDLSSTTLSSVETIKAGTAAATTFTVDQDDLADGGALQGSSGSDTLIVNGTGVDLTSSTVTNVEILKAGTSAATTFTVDQQDLALGGSVLGSSGTDTLVIKGTGFDLSSTAVSSVEILQTGSTGATTFTVDNADLINGGSILGSGQDDTLTVSGTLLDLGGTTLSSVEILKAGTGKNTSFVVDAADLASGGSVQGDTGSDTLIADSTALDLTSTTLSSVEILKAGNSGATTFTVDQADLLAGGSVQGSSGTDTITTNGSGLDFSATTLSGVEIIKAGISEATTFTVDNGDLINGGSVIGSSGIDTVAAATAALDLGSTTLSSVEVIRAGTDNDTTLTVDSGDLASGGSVIGAQGTDTLVVNGTLFDLTSTTLSNVETLQAGSNAGTTFKVDDADIQNITVLGGTGKDTLAAGGTALDLGNTALNSIEVIKAGTTADTSITVDQSDLAKNGTIEGNSGIDTLIVKDQAIDLTATTLSSIDVIKAGNTGDTTFTVDGSDLASGGSVIGNAGTDTLTTTGTLLDTSGTAISSVEILAAGASGDTTFKVDQGDLASGGSVIGGAEDDTLLVNGTSLDLTSTTLSSVETLKAGSSGATTFTVDQDDLSNDPSAETKIVGSSGTDTLVVNGTIADLRNTTMTSVEVIKAASDDDTTFFVDLADLASGGSVIGGAGNDTLLINAASGDLSNITLTGIENIEFLGNVGKTFTLSLDDIAKGKSLTGSSELDTVTHNGTGFDLSKITLNSVEVIRGGSSLGTTFTVDQSDLANGGVVIGSSGTDTLAAKGTALDLSSTALTSVEVIKAGTAATTITVNQNDLQAGGSVIGSAGNDILKAAGTLLDLRSSTLTSIETIQAGSASTTFMLELPDIVKRTVAGGAGSDTLIVRGTSFNVADTTLSSVEILKASSTENTLFDVQQVDLVANGSVVGGAGDDTLSIAGTLLDLRSTTLTSVEEIRAAFNQPTTFIVDQSDLLSGGIVRGLDFNDTLTAAGTELDLTSTTLINVETLKAGTSQATTFIVNQADLNPFGAVKGSSGIDTIEAKGGSLNLSGTQALDIEILKAGSSNNTVFSVDQADLAKGGSVIGNSGSDVLVNNVAYLDLSSSTLTSVETLKAGIVGTNFVVDQADLASGGQVIGTTGNDTLTIKATLLDLSSTTLTSVESIGTFAVGNTTFVVDQADLASGGTVSGNTGKDTLIVNGTSFDLTETTLKNVEILKSGSSANTTFTVDLTDLAVAGSVVGSSGNDTLIVAGTNFNVASTTLSSVETLKAGASTDTKFTVNQADLLSGGMVQGSTGTDTLAGVGIIDLTSTTLSSVEVIGAGAVGASTWKVDAADLINGGSVTGSSSVDTLIVNGTAFDLSSTTLSSVEILKTGDDSATTFTLQGNDLTGINLIYGSSGTDTLVVQDKAFNLKNATLSSVEVLQAGSALATTFTVNQLDLAKGGSVLGSSGTDTLLTLEGQLDLRSTTVSSVEILKSATSLATTFSVDAVDLAPGGAVQGNLGSDTLLITGTSFDTTSTTLSSVEVLKTGATTATTFNVDTADLASGGSVIGGAGIDTLIVHGSALDLTASRLSSIEILKTASTTGTTFTLDQADLAINSSVIGNTGNDTLVVRDTLLDIKLTSLSSIETIKAGNSNSTTFNVTQADLLSGGTVQGSSGSDTLAVFSSIVDLTSTTMVNVETIKAGTAVPTTFRVDQADIVPGTTIEGAGGKDTLIIQGDAFDLTGVTLKSIDILKAGSTAETTFTVDQSNLALGGSVVGDAGTDTLMSVGTALNLTSTVLTSVEVLKAGGNSPTTFTVDQADLAANGSVLGNTGTDTLLTNASTLDLRSTTLSSVEILKLNGIAPSTLTADLSDVAGRSVQGTFKNDTLTIAGTDFDLTSTSLSTVEILKASVSGTTFTVDQDDLLSGGSVIGSTGTDTLAVGGTQIDLSSTALSSVEILKASTTANTVFLVNQADLAIGSTVEGNAGIDTLSSTATVLDLTKLTLSSVEVIATAATTATSFLVAAGDLASGGSVVGNAGSDTLSVNSTSYNLQSTTLSSVEILKATATAATLFTVDADDLVLGGSVVGSAGKDTLSLTGTDFDLRSTTLSSVEILKTSTSADTTFTVDQADLLSAGSVVGSSGTDTLTVNALVADLSSTTLSSVEILKATATGATSFIVDQNDLLAQGSVVGAGGDDTLTAKGIALNLTSTTLTSVEVLKAGFAAATTFTVDQSDLASGGSVVGNTGADTLVIASTDYDLSSTTFSSVEILKAGDDGSTTFTLNQSHLAKNGLIYGSSGTDTLLTTGTTLDLSSTTLFSVETLKAGTNDATVFTVDQADLVKDASIQGGAGDDTLVAKGGALDLRSATLSGIEILQVGAAISTTLTVDQADLASGGSVIGGAGNDLLVTSGTLLDLTSTTLSSIETLKAGTGIATTFALNQDDLVSGGTIMGAGGRDTILIDGTSLNLTSSTVTSIDILEAGSTQATTFTIDAGDLTAGGSILGNAGTDTLIVKGGVTDLRSMTLSSVEILRAGASTATTFTVNQADLMSGGSVIGSIGNDTLALFGSALDLTSTTLSNVEILQYTTTSGRLDIDAADLAVGGSVFGAAGAETLSIDGTSFDLTSTTISSVEYLKAGSSAATVFTVNQNDLAANGFVIGSSGNDTLIVTGTSVDLGSTSLSSVEILQAASAQATVFAVNQADLASQGSIVGSADIDTLVIKGTSLDLSGTTLSSVEILKAGLASATTFIVDMSDLAGGGSIMGSSSNDTLIAEGTSLDLTGTTLSSVEILKAGSASSTIFTVEQSDLGSGGSIMGSSGSDTLAIAETSIDLSGTALTSIETIKAENASDTTFILNQADLIANGTVAGNAGIDTLVANDTSLSLHATELVSVEIIKAGASTATIFTVDQSDLASGGSVIGSAGDDILRTAGSVLDLRSTTLDSIETVAAAGGATSFIIDDDGHGLTIAGNTGADSFKFVEGYGLSDVTDDNTILADTATIANFSVVSNEIIDVSALTVNGTAVLQSQASTQAAVDFADPTILKDALNAAAAIDGGTNSVVTSFQYGGATYVLIDNSAASELTTEDVVIKLTGNVTLNSGDFVL